MVGSGPQAFDQPFFAHRTPAATQHADDTAVAAYARLFQVGDAAARPTTARSTPK